MYCAKQHFADNDLEMLSQEGNCSLYEMFKEKERKKERKKYLGKFFKKKRGFVLNE